MTESVYLHWLGLLAHYSYISIRKYNLAPGMIYRNYGFKMLPSLSGPEYDHSDQVNNVSNNHRAHKSLVKSHQSLSSTLARIDDVSAISSFLSLE